MELRLVKYPDPILKKKARPLSERELTAGTVDGMPIQELTEAMLDLMRRENGVGLAAPQAGLSLRIFVIHLPKDSSGPLVAINPEIIETRGSEIAEEGCLSFPDIRGEVKRGAEVVMECSDVRGRRVECRAKGLLARAIQHEYDHLEGTLLVDRLSPARRLFLRRELKELEEEYRRRLARSPSR